MSSAEVSQASQRLETVVNRLPVWQPDNEVTECFLCNEEFTFFFRRHHCRRCGKVVCGRCSSTKTVYDSATPIISPPNTLFAEPAFEPHRTCDYCVEELIVHNVSRNATDHSETTLNNDENAGSSSRVLTRPAPIGRIIKDSADQRTRTVNETDEESERDHCPVCSLDLSTMPSELAREQHVNDCLIKYEFSGSPEQTRSNNRMLVYKIPEFSDTPNDHSVGSDIKEKFNFNDNECVICLEDLAPGDKVGRLECLCVFHYKCIKGWFEKKGPGNCPVHAVHL